jgi:hypothetical protein
MLEVGRIFEISESGHAMALGVMRCFHIPGERRREGSRTKEEHFAACQLEGIDH